MSRGEGDEYGVHLGNKAGGQEEPNKNPYYSMTGKNKCIRKKGGLRDTIHGGQYSTEAGACGGFA